MFWDFSLTLVCDFFFAARNCRKQCREKGKKIELTRLENQPTSVAPGVPQCLLFRNQRNILDRCSSVTVYVIGDWQSLKFLP